MMLLVPAVVAVLGAVPQGPRLEIRAEPPTLPLPDRPDTMGQVPFVDAAGLPIGHTLAGFAAADLDGNRIPDAVWLGAPLPGAPGSGGPLVAVAMGREHSPGRFRPWPVPMAVAGQPTAVARFRQAWLEQDAVLLADPTALWPTRLQFDLASSGDPHLAGGFTATAFTLLPPAYGARQLATANHEGDGCDDLAVVYDRGAAGCTLVKYRLDAPYGVALLLGATTVDLPLPAERLRLADFDGDGRSDLVVELPGYGVLVARDDGSPTLQFGAFVPAGPLADLAVGRFGSSDALAIGTASGVLAVWLDAGNLAAHWLPAGSSTSSGTVGGVALLPATANGAELVALAADGRTLWHQLLQRGASSPPAAAEYPADLTAYAGGHLACGLTSADLDGDGDPDLLAQHPDGATWYTIRHALSHRHPELLATSHDLSLQTLGWYGTTFTFGVPQSWDLQQFPSLELLVAVEHPYTGAQLRWERATAAIGPQRTASFTVQWQDNAATTAAFLANPYLVPASFRQAGHLSAGRRTQLHVLGIGPGNPNYAGAECRSEPLFLHTDPGGNGNKSAQGVVWEKRATPPLPRADTPLLPWQ